MYGGITKITDPNGVITTRAYGGHFGRLSRETRGDGTYITSTYNDCGTGASCLIGDHTLVVSQVLNNKDGSVQTDGTIYLDRLDRVVAASNRLMAAGTYDRNELRYDNLGRVAKTATPCTWSGLATACPYWTTRTYDALGRVKSSQSPISGSAPSRWSYHADTIIATDSLSNARTRVVPASGLVGELRDAYGYQQTFSYDAAGSLVGVSDSLGSTLLSAQYDYGIGAFRTDATEMDLDVSTAPGQHRHYTYDSLGDVVQWTDARGSSFSAKYDSLGRMIQRLERDLYSLWTWGSNPANHEVGKLIAACTGIGTNPVNCTTAPGHSESESYDLLGRLQHRSIVIPSDSTYTYTWSYDANRIVGHPHVSNEYEWIRSTD
jgi:YD repeat-containing protein